jgi:AcrR family transcriptional regulator
MFDEIEECFAAAGRTPKGQRALRTIYRVTRELLLEYGLGGTSLERIAERADLSQAALRHYFATRDELLTAFFVAATDWFRSRMAAMLTTDGLPAREQLEHCVGWHLEYMEKVDTLFWLEAAAYWLRQKPSRQVRDEWYTWLTGRYAELIARMQPAVGRRECERKAFAIMTLVLGAWTTHGRGSAVASTMTPVERRQFLIDTAVEIATQ